MELCTGVFVLLDKNKVDYVVSVAFVDGDPENDFFAFGSAILFLEVEMRALKSKSKSKTKTKSKRLLRRKSSFQPYFSLCLCY